MKRAAALFLNLFKSSVLTLRTTSHHGVSNLSIRSIPAKANHSLQKPPMNQSEPVRANQGQLITNRYLIQRSL